MLTSHPLTSYWRRGMVLGSLALIVLVGWYLASPLFVNHSVNEASPIARLPLAENVVPQALAQGRFGLVDAIHHGQGIARLLELPDGTRMLRLEDFMVTNGPDLYVYLSGHPSPRDSGQLHDHGAYEVGQLKGNIGDQNYELPADLELGPFASVVIYCRRFGVVFSTAALLHMQEE